MPELYAELLALESKIGTSEEQKALDAMFLRIQSQSIDFGILEHAKNCVVVPSEDLQWDDVGSWDSWAKLFTRDANANLFKGDVVGVDSHDCVVLTDKKPIAVVGLSNIVVIDAGDAILVCAEDKVQDVKKVVEALKSKGRKELL
jgi:mannose-1-phosphate guanylyltransferase